MDEPTVKSVGKALALLDCLLLADVQGEQVSLSELARATGNPANTVHNLLKTMVACGYVARSSHGRYAPGPRMRQIGRLNRLAEPARMDGVLAEMGAFSRTEGETCVLATLVAGERVVVASVDGAHAVRVSHATVEHTPFFAKATGRILAAFAEPGELDRILERHGFPGAAWDGLSDRDALSAALGELRSEGACIVRETDMGVVAAACPVLDREGSARGAAGAFAPEFRCPPDRAEALLHAVRQLAAKLAEHLA
jgi:IclR family acetate operon transcriptional repressor